MLHDKLQGRVTLRSEGVIIATDVGVLTYEADDEEWYFTGDRG